MASLLGKDMILSRTMTSFTLQIGERRFWIGAGGMFGKKNRSSGFWRTLTMAWQTGIRTLGAIVLCLKRRRIDCHKQDYYY
jgi:hypothetical protein